MINLDLTHTQLDLSKLSQHFTLLNNIPTRNFTDWLNLPEDKNNTIGTINNFIQEKGHQFKHIIACGIGGSSLGIITLQKALFPQSQHKSPETKQLTVMDNLDSCAMKHIIETIEPQKTLILIISKSGGTLETMTQFLFFKKHFGKSLYHSNFVFITDPAEGALRAVAEKDNIRTFPIPSGVGGRFSVLTALGLLPTALMGKDPKKLLEGAAAMKQRCLEKSNQNPALQLAALTYNMFPKSQQECSLDGSPCIGGKGGIVAMMSYSDQLHALTLWYQQLLAESIGKSPHIGLTPLPLRGSTDQHSVLQLLQEGPKDKLVIFLDLEKPETDILLEDIDDPTDNFGYIKGRTVHDILRTELQGTAKALANDGRPNVTIKVPQINEHSIGELFFLLEMQIAILGELYQIDAYNQPGVEKSKLITKALLKNA
jgi:glucose-6-phosphate isomerase